MDASEQNALLEKQAEILKKQILALQEQSVKLSASQLDKLKELQSAYKSINVELKKAEATRLKSFSDQVNNNKSLGSIYSDLTKLDKTRIEKNIELKDISAEINEKISRAAEINQELAQLGSNDITQKMALNAEYDANISALDEKSIAEKSMIDMLNEQNKLAQQYSNISSKQKDILQGQHDVLDGIKKTIIGTIETAVSLYGNLQGAFGGVVTLAGMLEHHISDVNKTLGYTLTDMNSAAKSAGVLSFFFDDAAGTARELSSQLGSVEMATFATQRNVGLISETMGISNVEASQLIGNFARMNGGSTAIAADMIQTTKEFAKQNNVIPADVLSDLAASAEEFALYSKNGGKNLIQAAVGARQLGVSLGTVTGIADNLLDFESSITKELELGAMLGRNINLNKARQLAYDGDIEKAAQETLKQLGGISAFNEMDVFQKRASAEAIGVSVGELQKMLDNQTRIKTQGDLINEKFSALGSTIDAGLNKYLGTTLKGLGGLITASAQVGGNFAQMGFSLKGIGNKLKSLLPSIGSAGSLLSDKQIAAGFGGKKAKDELLSKKQGVPGKSIMDGMSKIDMNKVLKGAAAMVIVAAAVFVFGKAVQEFMKVSWESVGMAVTSMLALVGAVALLGLLLSGPQSLLILAGAAAMLVVAGAMYVLGKAIQEISTGFSALGMIGSTIGELVSMIGGIGSLTTAFMGLAGSLMFLGTAGLVALPGLLGLSMAAKGLGVVADILGVGSNSAETTGGIEEGSLSEYQTQMLEKMDKLIQATMSNRDVYLDREKVTNVIMKTGERKTENVFGLGVA